MLEIIHDFGYLGVFLTIFLEVGLMIFPLPGDTLLFTTGILSDSGRLDYFTLLLVCTTASIISGHVGYFIGSKLDKETLLNNKIYKIKDSHLHKTEKFFEDYGIYAIIFSRFVPIVRNFLSQILGIINYDKRKFFIANIIASIIWPLVIVTAGKVFGRMFPNLVTYAEILMVIILVVLVLPFIVEFWKNKKASKNNL